MLNEGELAAFVFFYLVFFFFMIISAHSEKNILIIL